MVKARKAFRIFVGKSLEFYPLGRPRRRWEVNIKINLRQVVKIRGVVLARGLFNG
jgi:hypothetical protein